MFVNCMYVCETKTLKTSAFGISTAVTMREECYWEGIWEQGGRSDDGRLHLVCSEYGWEGGGDGRHAVTGCWITRVSLQVFLQ